MARQSGTQLEPIADLFTNGMGRIIFLLFIHVAIYLTLLLGLTRDQGYMTRNILLLAIAGCASFLITLYVVHRFMQERTATTESQLVRWVRFTFGAVFFLSLAFVLCGLHRACPINLLNSFAVHMTSATVFNLLFSAAVVSNRSRR